MSFLTSDEAHELFTRTLGASAASALFVQRTSSGRRAKVVKMLTQAAVRARDPRLSTLAVRMRLDSFEKVKETLANMVETLTKEKEEDIKHKDACIDSFNKNDAATQTNTHTKEKEIAKVDDLSMSIDELTKAIDVLTTEIAEAEKQMKRAGEDREIANKEYQVVIADQRATEKLLTATLNVLKGFYEKAALAQTAAHTS